MSDLLLSQPTSRGRAALTGRCIACGRALTDPASQARGYGPVCGGKLTVRGGSREQGVQHATFIAELAAGVIVLVDQDQGRSVTNDAEWVVAELRRIGFNLRLPVIYRDTSGRWDRLLVRDGAFAGFGPLGASTYLEARKQLHLALAAGG